MTDYTQRKYDLVVFGATGFTGELTCEYLIEIKDKDLKWAIAGRSLKRLESVKERLVKLDSSLQDLELLIADSNDADSLDKVLKQTRVVISTVGPFIKYGTLLVEACVRQQTHYVDTTGEYPWVKQLIDKYDQEAKDNHVMIVPTCGFDSVPSDLGCYMLSKYAHEKHQLDLAQVKMSVMKIKGGVSGGTIQSSVGIMMDSPLSTQEQMDPYLLVSSTRHGVDKPYLPFITRDADFNDTWQTFFFMSVVNEKVVRRSWSIWAERGHGYGSLFSYREYMRLPFISAILYTCTLFTLLPLFLLLLKVPVLNTIIKDLLPGTGSGPSREKRANGMFELQFVGTTETEPYDEPVRIRGIVKGFRDPGYGDTCRMVAESALSIVHHLDELPGKEGGLLTPATAFGDVLINRLTQNQGMVFEVNDM